MFYFPVFVNQSRFHYCKLMPPQAELDQVEFSFIVQQVPGHAVELLRIYKGTRFISARGFESDLKFSAREMAIQTELNAQGVPELVVRIQSERTTESETESASALAEAGFQWIQDQGDLRLQFRGMEPGPVRLTFVLDTGEGNTYRGSFLLVTAPPKNIFDAVFDFGSEASQIAVHQRGTEPNWEPRINLLDRLLFDFYAPALHRGHLTRYEPQDEPSRVTLSSAKRERFMAYDHHPGGVANPHLFNSSFFVLRNYHCDEASGPAPDISAAPFAEGDQEWVSLLGDTNDRRYMVPKHDRDYEIVPNLKLAELGITRDFTLCVEGDHVSFAQQRIQACIFRRVLNQFLHLLLREIELNHRDNRHKLLKLTVLVPNIYSQLRVSKLIRDLYRDLRTIVLDNDYGFVGVEVQTLSESDAALLGLLTDPGVEGLDHTHLRPDEHCLVIDSGKGTTDISIVSVGEDKQYSSVFRSGFAGAGNALTYAFADTLFAAIVGPEKRSEREQFLKQFLETADLATRYEFHQHLEAVKQNYGKRHAPDYTYTREEFTRMFAGIDARSDLTVLRQKLEEQFSRPAKTMQDYFGIVSATIDRLVQMAVKKVQNSQVDQFSIVVLSGRSFLMQDYRDRLENALREKFNIKRVIFRPANLKSSCLLGPLNHPRGINRNSDLIGTPIFHTGERRLASWLERIRDRIPGARNRPNSTNINLRYFFLQGEDFDPGAESVTICGREPILDGIANDEAANLVYVGEDFLLRGKHSGAPLRFGHRTGQSLNSDPLAWMSLFPHVKGPGYVHLIQPSAAHKPARPANASDPIPRREPQPPTSPPPSREKSTDDDMWDYI